MIEWGFIGIVVGFLLGLTGAGGAVVAVPLFIYLTGASLVQATVYSLFAVIIGAAIGWIPQRKNTDWRVVPLFSGFSLMSAALLVEVKALSPDWLIASLFVAVCALSLFSIWRKRAPLSKSAENASAILLRGAFGGLLLGALVTMTGLGGGVILMPILLGWIRLPMMRATATSLMTICLTSLLAVGLQRNSLPASMDLSLIGALAIGSILSSIAVKAMIERWDARVLDPVRRFVITAVVTGAALGVAMGS